MEKTKQKQITDFLINNGVIIVMFILVIVAGLTTQNFFTLNNLNNLLNNMSFRLVIALGIAGCVITAGCDLSAGRLIGLGGCISGVLLQRMDYSGKFFPDMQPLNVFLAALVAMLICAVFGTITGFFIAYLSVPPFIATLATMEIVYGLVVWILLLTHVIQFILPALVCVVCCGAALAALVIFRWELFHEEMQKRLHF